MTYRDPVNAHNTCGPEEMLNFLTPGKTPATNDITDGISGKQDQGNVHSTMLLFY